MLEKRGNNPPAVMFRDGDYVLCYRGTNLEVYKVSWATFGPWLKLSTLKAEAVRLSQALILWPMTVVRYSKI